MFCWAIASSDDTTEEFVSDSLQASSEDFVEVAERMMNSLVPKVKGKNHCFACYEKVRIFQNHYNLVLSV